MREERKLGTELGLEAEKSTNQGQLVPDRIVNALVEAWLSRHDGAFVFDGYPRSFGQATALDEVLAKRGTHLDVVLSLEVDLATITEDVLDVTATQFDRVRYLSLPASTPVDVLIRQHRAILDAVLERRPAIAERELRKHLREVLQIADSLASQHQDLIEADL